MDDKHARRSDGDLEAMLRDLDAEDLELLEPPEEVWEGIESAVRATDDAGTVVQIESRRRRARRTVLGIAAALVLAAAGVAGYTLTRDDPAVVVASASLAYDSETFDALGARARAGADLIAEDGMHSIAIVDAALPAPEAGADLEVWLIRPDAEGNVADLVSLGVVDPDDPGSLDVPTGYDPADYFVVDISVEPRDGDPTHSGRSILRGPLNDV
ncbi:MAG: anti-sigma factor [Acidimicrobiia bacterium]|nr:anti-sigma factor [Acidimicrobiia bacterium]